MSDVLLQQFYFRAAWTLSVGYEVYKELERGDDAAVAVARLELELATWKREVEACASYETELLMADAALAAWRHSGNIGDEPKRPDWPNTIPLCGRPAINSLKSFAFCVSQFQETIEHSLPRESFEGDLRTLASSLDHMGKSLDEIKESMDCSSSRIVAGQRPNDPPAVIDNLVTLDQVAPLTGLSKRTLERYLTRGKLPDPDVRGGGGRSHKWYWNNIRKSLNEISKRPMPDCFPAGRII